MTQEPIPFDPCPELAAHIRAQIPAQVAKANAREYTLPRPSNVAGYVLASIAEAKNGR